MPSFVSLAAIITGLMSLCFASLLFLVYQRQKINILIRTCCIVIITTNLLIFVGFFIEDNSTLQIIQAIILNYLFISIHAHLSLMMFNNLIMALGWHLRIFQSSFCKNWLFLIISFAYPLLPTLILSILLTSYHIENLVVFIEPCLSVISDPNGYLTIIHYFPFFILGIITSIYLIAKILESRQNLANASQIGIVQVIKIISAISVYIIFGFISLIPFSVPAVKRLKYNIADGENIFAITFPSSIGILFFLMYGFSTTSKAEIRKLFSRTQRSNRRMSTVPLIEDLENSNK